MDFQRDIIADSPLAPSDPEARQRLDAAVDRASAAIAAARLAGLRVIHVRLAYSPGYPEASPHTGLARFMREHGALLEGSDGARFDVRVAPIDDEAVITKHGVSAFVGTRLSALLAERSAESLVMCGLVTHYVVEGTARHAADLGHRVIVLEDACDSATRARHDMALTNLGPLAERCDVQTFARACADASG